MDEKIKSILYKEYGNSFSFQFGEKVDLLKFNYHPVQLIPNFDIKGAHLSGNSTGFLEDKSSSKLIEYSFFKFEKLKFKVDRATDIYEGRLNKDFIYALRGELKIGLKDVMKINKSNSPLQVYEIIYGNMSSHS